MKVRKFKFTMLELHTLKKGQRAVIRSFRNKNLSDKLMDMGCLPGEEIVFSRTAPLGCPCAIYVAGYELSLRRDEASSVLVELVA